MLMSHVSLIAALDGQGQQSLRRLIMLIKLVTLAVLSLSLSAAGATAQPVQIADGEGDLNPQPLPP